MGEGGDFVLQPDEEVLGLSSLHVVEGVYLEGLGAELGLLVLEP